MSIACCRNYVPEPALVHECENICACMCCVMHMAMACMHKRAHIQPEYFYQVFFLF